MNSLLITKDSQNIEDFFQCCLEYTKHEKVVLLLTTSSVDLLPVIKNACLRKEELKRLVIIHLDNMDAFIQKMLDQHDWTWIPSLIVVDLRSVIEKLSDELNLIDSVQNALQDCNSTETAFKPVAFIQQLALFIASLFGYYESVIRRLKKLKNSKQRSVPNVDMEVFSVLILKEHSVHLSKKQIQLLINLYYYSNNAFDDQDELIEILKIEE